MKRKCKGAGLLNDLIDLIPGEKHLPFYNYCGPSTKLEERLARGDKPINGLDEACRSHDIEYSKTSDTKERNKADLVLADKAWERVKASDSSLGEKAAAWLVTNSMKLKAKLGMGCGECGNDGVEKKEKKKKKSVKSGVYKQADGFLPDRAHPASRKQDPAKVEKKKKKKKATPPSPRIIPVPATGGALMKILTSRIGLSPESSNQAMGKIGIHMAGRKSRHRRTRIGEGLYLALYKQGYGLYLKPPSMAARLN
ncbi:uncharacterized protein [Bemisia tabaci]|uniref:uncharacterized protein n=1 Tax=Bemisia tabaci TaxID=7038 RepID=UPI003B288E34